MKVRGFLLVLAVVVALAGGATGAVGRGSQRLLATLDGSPIPLARVGTLQCHDFDHPVIRCFRSSEKLEQAVATRIRALHRLGKGKSLQNLTYVRIFEHSLYNGASLYIATDIPRLGDIGWNDKITSFKVQNLGTGTFYTANLYSGSIYDFTHDVGNVGSQWNDTFSSVTGSI